MSEYTPTTEEVYRRFWRGTPLRSEDKLREYVALDRWLNEVKREVWDEAVNQVIATVRCDSEDITWVNKNPYRQES